MASATHAMARTLGGGGEKGLLIQMAVVSAMSDQNDRLPVRVRQLLQKPERRRVRSDGATGTFGL